MTRKNDPERLSLRLETLTGLLETLTKTPDDLSLLVSHDILTRVKDLIEILEDLESDDQRRVRSLTLEESDQLWSETQGRLTGLSLFLTRQCDQLTDPREGQSKRPESLGLRPEDLTLIYDLRDGLRSLAYLTLKISEKTDYRSESDSPIKRLETLIGLFCTETDLRDLIDLLKTPSHCLGLREEIKTLTQVILRPETRQDLRSSLGSLNYLDSLTLRLTRSLENIDLMISQIDQESDPSENTVSIFRSLLLIQDPKIWTEIKKIRRPIEILRDSLYTLSVRSEDLKTWRPDTLTDYRSETV